MRVMNCLIWRAGFCLAALVALTGCSETGFQDFMNVGKNVPDERAVRSNQNLVMPPDLALRSPSGGQPQPRQPVVPNQPVPTQPPAYQPQAPQQPAYQPQAPQQPAYQPQPQPQQPAYQPPAAPDKYAELGISRVRADGTQKTQTELDAEVRRVRAARQKQQNPNYGTIWNLPQVFDE